MAPLQVLQAPGALEASWILPLFSVPALPLLPRLNTGTGVGWHQDVSLPLSLSRLHLSRQQGKLHRDT